ncbi:MAG: protogloblin ApPgb [Caldilineae bacterium]|nr:MAG: protogloblin ApPgb [Caldilineae bacterium]
MSTATTTGSIPGYAFGDPSLPRAPLSDEDFQKLKATVLFTEDDERYLRMAGDVLEDQIDDVLDLWYNFVGSHPHLVYYFTDPQGEPIGDYLQRVRARFGQWILDTCRRPYDRAWLDYQYEIGLRHHRTKKNQTDGIRSVDHIPLRYLIAFIYPITATIRSFLEKKGHSAEDVEGMHQAWFKSVTLQTVLWSIPYARSGDW